MLWAACCTRFLRSGKISIRSDKEYDPSTHLSFGDIAVDSYENTSTIAIKIKASKTDPYRQGIMIYLGATNTKLCPVKAILAYIAVRGSEPGLPFMFANQQGLTGDKLVLHVRRALTKAGINPDLYASHSFRIGAATVAHMKGIEDSAIMTLGRWKSNAYQRYVRIPQEHLAQLYCHIATPVPSAKLQVFHPLLED